MQRRTTRKKIEAGAEETTAPEPTEGETPVDPPAAPRRGRKPGSTNRRSSVTRRAAQPARTEAAAVVEALLKSRSVQGATQDELAQAVTWAQETRAEGDALKQEALPRRAPRGSGKSAQARAAAVRQQEARVKDLKDRTTRHAVNQALLDGVLAGAVMLDVVEGHLVFRHAGAAVPAPPPASGTDPVEG